MKRLRFKKIDAFAQRNANGNPAGAIYLNPDEKLDTYEMLRIAKELEDFVNEVAFVHPEHESEIDFSLIYYSSEREVDFCGHATIAVMYDLIRENPNLLTASNVRIKTKMGILSVENHIKTDDAVFIQAPAAIRKDIILQKDEIANVLGTIPKAIDPTFQVALVNAGLNTLIVPIAGFEDCIGIQPDFQTLKNACVSSGVDIVALFSTETSNPSHKFRTRVFAPTFGYLEDPATGSASAALGNYWRDEGLWDGNSLVLEQGTDRENPNIVRLKTSSDPKPGVLFGGAATVRIEGEYILA